MSTRSAGPAAVPWPEAASVPAGPDEQTVTGQVRAQVAAAFTSRAQDREDAGQDPLPAAGRLALVTTLIGEALEERATAALGSGQQALDAAAEARVTQAVTAALLGLGGLQVLPDDPAVENIDVNGYDQVFVGYAGGRIARAAPVAASDADLAELIRTIAARAGTEERRFDRARPRLTIQLPDGSRLFAVMSVTAAAEGEGGDGPAEGPGGGLGDVVAVFLGGDPGEVGDRGVQAEDPGDPLEGDELAELGCPADLAGGLPFGEGAGDGDRAGLDLQGPGEVVVGGDLIWTAKREARASVRTAPWTRGCAGLAPQRRDGSPARPGSRPRAAGSGRARQRQRAR